MSLPRKRQQIVTQAGSLSAVVARLAKTSGTSAGKDVLNAALGSGVTDALLGPRGTSERPVSANLALTPIVAPLLALQASQAAASVCSGPCRPCAASATIATSRRTTRFMGPYLD